MVDVVRRVFGVRRIGHLGTLDPFAEGLLVLVVGRATRLAPFAAGWTKAYEGVIRLGVTTATDDPTGEVVASASASGLGAAQLQATLAGFQGGYLQHPPAYSAVKIAGERAYRRARRGEVVAPAARRVEIRTLELLDYAAPDLRFRATVGAGTYLRSLARDIGAALGCGGHLFQLRRTAVGPFRLDQAVPPDAVVVAGLRDPAVLVDGLARRELDGAEREAAVHGRAVVAGSAMPETGSVALFAGDLLVAVAERAGEVLKPRVVVVEA